MIVISPTNDEWCDHHQKKADDKRMNSTYPHEITWVHHALGKTSAKTAVHLWGNPDNTPLVLLHGFMQTAVIWDTVANALAKDWFVIAPELVGHGLTEIKNPQAQGAFSFEGAAQQVSAVVDEFCAQRPFVLGGYSLGGRVVEQIISTKPDLVASVLAVVIESSALGPDSEEQRQAFREANAKTIERLKTMPFEDFIAFWENLPLFESQKNLPEEIREKIHLGRLANDPVMLALVLKGLGKENMTNCREALAQCKMPVLYMAGGLDSKYQAEAELLEQAFEKVQKQRDGSKVITISRAGHNIHIEQPDQFVDALYTFLESLI